jgi:phage shock protein PspC (stress-responsive transcriptional regulator)
VNQRRLYRSTDDRILAGVAGGVAAYFDVDPVIVRIIWFFSVFFTGSLTFWAYIIMIIVVPTEPDDWQRQPASPWAPGGEPIGGPTGFGAAYTPATPAPGGPAATPAASTESGTTGEPAPGASGEPSQGAAGAASPTDPNLPPASAPFSATQSNQWTPGPSDWRWQRRQDRWQRRQERWEARGTNGGLVFGLLLIIVGGILAWHQVDPNVDLGLAWPIGAIALGVLLVASSFRPGGAARR